MTLEIRLIDANGTELWKDVRTEASSITAQRGETFESARQRVFDRLARWTVSAPGKGMVTRGGNCRSGSYCVDLAV